MDYYKSAYKHITKVPADPQKALKYLNKAHAKGNPHAAYALGTWYLYGQHVEKNFRTAIALLKEAARHNIADALFDLAICYEKGEGIKKNDRLAFENYMRAALYGDQQAVLEVGRCYYYGIGVTKSRRLSDIWLERAETLGISEKVSKSTSRKVQKRVKENGKKS